MNTINSVLHLLYRLSPWLLIITLEVLIIYINIVQLHLNLLHEFASLM